MDIAPANHSIPLSMDIYHLQSIVSYWTYLQQLRVHGLGHHEKYKHGMDQTKENDVVDPFLPKRTNWKTKKDIRNISHRIRMYAIYGSTFTINIPQMFASIYHTYGSVMGIGTFKDVQGGASGRER